MAIALNPSSPSRRTGAYYHVQASDLLIKFTGDRAPSGWTVIPEYPELCWHRATQSDVVGAHDLAYPPLRPNPRGSGGMPSRSLSVNDCCRAAVVEELRGQSELLRKRGRAQIHDGFAAGLILAGDLLEEDADALESRQSALVDGAG